MTAPAEPAPAVPGPGTRVRHANPALADWEGVIEPGPGHRWQNAAGRPDAEVRVRWTAGTGLDGQPLAGTEPAWTARRALACLGQCPACEQPAWYVPPDSPWNQPAGWHHDHGPCPRTAAEPAARS
jgi:hypothetical protein